MPTTPTIGSSPERSPFGEASQKYWGRRYSLFSRFDEGILLDEEGLFSVKPEAVAMHIASRLSGSTVLDAFCGVGGSAIAFARVGKTVITSDTSQTRLEMALRNAKIYGVEKRISFARRDTIEILRDRTTHFDAIYMDPAWGGPEYYKSEHFKLSMFSPDGDELLDSAFARECPLAFTVPKNFDVNEFAARKVSFCYEWNELDGTPIFATAYFG
jgi:trimethylguanosine synthase